MEKVRKNEEDNTKNNMNNKDIQLPDSITGASKGLRIRIPQERLMLCTKCFDYYSLCHFSSCPDIECE